MNNLVNYTELPFLATPMGKGVVPDSNRFCVASARTVALQHADVVVLLGARLNWILHFGKPPRFQPNVFFIQVSKIKIFNIQYPQALHVSIFYANLKFSQVFHYIYQKFSQNFSILKFFPKFLLNFPKIF